MKLIKAFFLVRLKMLVPFLLFPIMFSACLNDFFEDDFRSTFPPPTQLTIVHPNIASFTFQQIIEPIDNVNSNNIINTLNVQSLFSTPIESINYGIFIFNSNQSNLNNLIFQANGIVLGLEPNSNYLDTLNNSFTGNILQQQTDIQIIRSTATRNSEFNGIYHGSYKVYENNTLSRIGIIQGYINYLGILRLWFLDDPRFLSWEGNVSNTGEFLGIAFTSVESNNIDSLYNSDDPLNLSNGQLTGSMVTNQGDSVSLELFQ